MWFLWLIAGVVGAYKILRYYTNTLKSSMQYFIRFYPLSHTIWQHFTVLIQYCRTVGLYYTQKKKTLTKYTKKCKRKRNLWNFGNLMDSTKIYIYIIICKSSPHALHFISIYLHQLTHTYTHSHILITQRPTDHHDAITAMCGGFSISWLWLRV